MAKPEAANPKTKEVMEVKCPECHAALIVKKHREQVKKPVPGEWNEWLTAETDPQQTLPLDGEKAPGDTAEAAG